MRSDQRIKGLVLILQNKQLQEGIMHVKSNRKLLAALSMALVTSFVTACVKNESKNEAPKKITLKQMEVSAIVLDNKSGFTSVTLNDQSNVPAFELSKIYQFKIEEISELQIQRGTVNNKDCSVQEPFIYSFSLIDKEKNKKPLHTRQSKELLTPGNYSLKIDIQNGSLCKSISMNFILKLKKRKDLILTRNLDAGYHCFSVEENGSQTIRTSARVNTSPMRLVKYQENNLGTIYENIVIDDNTLCQGTISKKLSCKDQLSPASIYEHPIMAVKKHCQQDGQNHTRSNAYLQVNESISRNTINLTCSHKHKVLNYNLKQCDLIFMLGEELPLIKKQTDIIIRRNSMRVNFSIDENKINSESLPGRLFISVATRTGDDYYEPVLNNFYRISRNDIIDGHLLIREPQLRAKLASSNINRLKLVISTQPNLKKGLFKISMSDVCSENSEAIVSKKGGITELLCE